jgi:ADP-ribose pyrophosphatase
MLKQQTCGPLSYPVRAAVGDRHDWDDPNYNPPFHHDPVLEQDVASLPPWADRMDVSATDVGARLTHAAGRKATIAEACVLDAKTGRYRNPRGKTGLRGRGRLGRWGANHAADCIVTRLNPRTGAAQALVVERVDGDAGSCVAWPGGMVEPGEEVPETLRAELTQEALSDTDAVARLFEEGRRRVLYQGWVDDHRNTDDAWMETTVVHFHADAALAADLELSTRDTHEVRRSYWMDMDDIDAMYASHRDWLLTLREQGRAALDKPGREEFGSGSCGALAPFLFAGVAIGIFAALFGLYLSARVMHPVQIGAS